MPPVTALAQQVAEKGVGGAVAAGLPRHNLSALNPDWRREAAATRFFSNLSEMGPLREVHELPHSCPHLTARKAGRDAPGLRRCPPDHPWDQNKALTAVSHFGVVAASSPRHVAA